MKRRTLLRAAAGGALGLAGCLSDGAGGEPVETDDPTGATDTDTPTDTDRPADTVSEPGGDGSDTPSGTPSDTPPGTATGTPDDEPSATPSGVADTGLKVTDSGCGTQTDEASVAFDEGTVTVTGTIWGSDACYTAVLSDVSLDGGALTVVVAAERDADEDTACADCIAEVDYQATVTFDGGLPAEVTVVHRHGGEDSKVTSTTR